MLQLDLPLMIAGAKERGELESRVTRLVAELKEDKNVVLMWVAGRSVLQGRGSTVVLLAGGGDAGCLQHLDNGMLCLVSRLVQWTVR